MGMGHGPPTPTQTPFAQPRVPEDQGLGCPTYLPPSHPLVLACLGCLQ